MRQFAVSRSRKSENGSFPQFVASVRTSVYTPLSFRLSRLDFFAFGMPGVLGLLYLHYIT
ncbi:MAG: hypothetical protein BWY65_01031 [Firmicutes bacterium ADurb.Bin373]|nr:MAG: hypothetical protein BWY65_01031 [Firmicutes bacterium ADurb.Bin373]